MSQSYLLLSGKGGAGKSTLTAALACAVGKRRIPVAAVDMDIGLRSLDMLLGMENKIVYDILDVTRKDCRLPLALAEHTVYPSLSLLPASQLGSYSDIGSGRFLKIVTKLRKRFPYILIDAPAGIGKGVKLILPSADQCLIIVTPDDVCIRGAERAISLVRDMSGQTPSIIVNRVIPKLVKSGSMYSPETISRALDAPLMGYVPDDSHIREALCSRQPLTELKCPAQAAVERIAARMIGAHSPIPELRRRGLFGRKEEGLYL